MVSVWQISLETVISNWFYLVENEMSAVKNGEDELKTQDMLKFAMHRNKSEAYHITPFANINDRFVDLPRTLQQIMSKHPYPLSQGPVQLPIDCLAMENYMQHPNPYPRCSLSRLCSVMKKTRAALSGLLFLKEFLLGVGGSQVTKFET